MNDDNVRVGMAEYDMAFAPTVISTLGLGSCVAICMHDPEIKLGGLVHIMLPYGESDVSNPYKFANLAIPLLLKKMEEKGAKKERLVVKIVGGAQMFNFSNADERMSIGPRNIEMVVETLKKLGLEIKATNIGGNCGKSVFLHTDSGKVFCRTIIEGEIEI